MKRGLRFTDYFEVEEPILDLLDQVRLLEAQLAGEDDAELATHVELLKEHVEALQREIYESLTPWEKVLMARHPRRPRFMDYVERLCDTFELLRGDRYSGDDPAILTGLGRIGGHTWAVIGHDRGRTPEEAERARHGMAMPAAFHKVMRVVRLAERFGFPVLTLIDTPGPAQGAEGETFGMAPTIARCLETFATLRTPTIAVLTGEGGSGGAIALGLTDRVYAQGNAIYSVISPEGCAAIIYRDANEAPQAAEQLKITADDLYRFHVVDGIIPEPLGGAHISPDEAATRLKEEVLRAFSYLKALPMEQLLQERYERFQELGEFVISPGSPHPGES